MIRFSKALTAAGYITDAYGLLTDDLPKAIKSGDWRSFFVATETLLAGYDAAALTAVAFSGIAGTASGALEYALIMALVGAMIDVVPVYVEFDNTPAQYESLTRKKERMKDLKHACILS